MLQSNNVMDNEKICYVLASASPRRRDLMAQAGFRFMILPAVGEEQASGTSPEETVRLLSGQKAREVAARMRSGECRMTDGHTPGDFQKVVIIGADTVVAQNGAVLGKPRDREDAKRMLRVLPGRTHEVYIGVTVIELIAGTVTDREVSMAERTEVDVLPISDEEIDSYLLTGESFDKAGAYGIQGRFAIHISGIRGDYYNVIGLPIAGLYRMLKQNDML